MSRFSERTRELRADSTYHYNCAQAVVIPFAEALGYDIELGLRMAEHFGAGMRMGATCGAVTGGLMALGLYGIKDQAVCLDYEKRVRARYQKSLNCTDLLAAFAKAQPGAEKKVHCDGIVFDCVDVVEEILKEQGLV